MPITTDYEVFSERYHFPSEMDRRQRANDKIASLEGQVVALQASEAKLTAENEEIKKAKIVVARASFDEKVREVTEHMKEAVNTMGKENEKLKGENRRLGFAVIGADEENKKLKAENEKIKGKDYPYKIGKLKTENDKLLKFITGGGGEKYVEALIMDDYAREFIDSNQEHWDQMELFQEESRWDYKDDEVDYYVNGGRKVVLKDGRVVKSKD